MNKALKSILTLFLLLGLASCGKEVFSVPKNSTSTTAPNVGTNSAFSCSNSTLIRPPVDILVLVDNSTSTNYISDSMKQSLNNIISQVSARFDYHIALAPLLLQSGQATNTNLRVAAYDVGDLSVNSSVTVFPKDYASTYMSFPAVSGSYENGVSRAVDLLKANQSNGIFRKSAFTIVTVISNGDDNSWRQGQQYPPASWQTDYVNSKVNELLCIRGNSGASGCSSSYVLNSRMMRFLSIVVPNNSSSCTSDLGAYYVGDVYKQVSSRIYSQPYTNGIDLPTDQSGKQYVDVVNLCTTNPLSVFDAINEIIQDVTIKHVYNYWPVANSDFDLDDSTIVATKNSGEVLNRLSSAQVNNIIRDNTGKNDTYNGSQISGWYYHGNTFENTRFLPSGGEPFTGHLIELFGEAKITYPSCLKVESQAKANHYGFAFVTPNTPIESTIEVYINSQKVPKSATNGWTLVSGKQNGHYIEIVGPGNYAQKPGGKYDSRSGHYIKLNGSYVYSNKSTILIQAQQLSN